MVEILSLLWVFKKLQSTLSTSFFDNPQSDGQTKRVNKAIGDMIQAMGTIPPLPRFMFITTLNIPQFDIGQLCLCMVFTLCVVS